MAQTSPRSILVLPNQLNAHHHIRLGLAGCLCNFNVRNSLIPSPPPTSPQHPLTCCLNSTNIVLLIVSAACIIVSITEIVLFATTRLHPLTYLTLQLIKTTTWFVLFVLAAVNTTRVQIEMAAKEEQGYSFGNNLEYFELLWFAEPLVLL